MKYTPKEHDMLVHKRALNIANEVFNVAHQYADDTFNKRCLKRQMNISLLDMELLNFGAARNIIDSSVKLQAKLHEIAPKSAVEWTVIASTTPTQSIPILLCR